MWHMIILVMMVAVLVLNSLVRRTNGYRNFYRAIHIMKDVPEGRKYDVATFGSTFSYYAFDVKDYNGHNFSVEPQSICYMQKTVKHFADNINEHGIAFFALTGCIFASGYVGQEDNCVTYYSYLCPHEFCNYKFASKCKYLMNRYFPLLNPHMAKYLIRDAKLNYSISGGISEEHARTHAKNRLKGWERVLCIDSIYSFEVSDALSSTMNTTVHMLDETIEYVKQRGIRPVLVILPMSTAFNEVCPKQFYDKILYSCVNSFAEKGITVLDYLYDEQLSDLDLYWTSDCLNTRGRRLLTQRMMKDMKTTEGDTL